MRELLGKIIATAIVLVVAWHVLGALGAQQPIVDAWGDVQNGDAADIPVDNPLGDLDPDEALELLDGIDVAAPLEVDYDRVGQFGNSWAFDFDTNGCDTRNDILARDMTDIVLDADNCTVLAGVLNDPYTGTVIDFTRGVDTSGAVQIDHIVGLAYAARHGALEWDQTTREGFANDPANLIAVSGPVNASKGDGGPGEWLPPNEAFHCDFVAAWVSVVADYDLSVTAEDAAAARDVLDGCTA